MSPRPRRAAVGVPGEPVRVLAVDPGLDCAGLACYEASSLDALDRMPTDARARAITWTGKITTPPAQPMPDRCHAIAAGVAQACAELGVGLALVEVPSVAGGAYRSKAGRGHARNSAAMGSFHMALGALLAGLRGAEVPVQLVRASTVPKPHRHTITKQLLRAGKWAGVKNPDVLCAIYVGLTADLREAARAA